MVGLTTMTVMSSVLPVPPPHYRIIRTDAGATKIPLPYRGSVILYPPELTEYLTVTRAPESVTAVAPVNKLYARLAPFFSRVYPASLAYPEMSGNSAFGSGNPEALLRLSPSAVILWSGFGTSLERAGVPVVRIGHRTNHWTVDNAMTFAALLGLDQRRTDLQQSYETSLQRLRQDLKIDRFTKRPRVLWVAILPDGSVVVPGEASPTGNVVAAAGGVIVPSRGGALSPELLFKVAADLIVVPFYPWLAGPDTIMRSPLWETLPAVRKLRVYREPNFNANFQTGIVETPLAARWLAELLYPKRLSHSLRALIVKKYRREFRTAISDRELDTELNLSANARSAGYSRFAR